MLTPLKAIRVKCLECTGHKLSLIRKCESKDCPLHFFRLGRNPNRKGVGGYIAAYNASFLAKTLGSTGDFNDNNGNGGICVGNGKQTDLMANKAEIDSGTTKLLKIQKLAVAIASLAKNE